MEVSFSITRDEARDLYRHHYAFHRALRVSRALLPFFAMGSALLVLIGIVLSVKERTYEPLLFCLAGIIYLILLFKEDPQWLPGELRRRIERTFVGSFQLKMGTKGVSIRGSVEEVTFGWSDVKEVHVEADYALLYMNSPVSILVPRRGVTDGTYDELTKELGRHVAEQNPRLPDAINHAGGQ